MLNKCELESVSRSKLIGLVGDCSNDLTFFFLKRIFYFFFPIERGIVGLNRLFEK